MVKNLKILRFPITRIFPNLHEQVKNDFDHEGIHLFADLLAKSEPQLLRIPNFGRRQLEELREAINKIGWELGELADIYDGTPERLDKTIQNLSDRNAVCTELSLAISQAPSLKAIEDTLGSSFLAAIIRDNPDVAEVAVQAAINALQQKLDTI